MALPVYFSFRKILVTVDTAQFCFVRLKPSLITNKLSLQEAIAGKDLLVSLSLTSLLSVVKKE